MRSPKPPPHPRAWSLEPDVSCDARSCAYRRTGLLGAGPSVLKCVWGLFSETWFQSGFEERLRFLRLWHRVYACLPLKLQTFLMVCKVKILTTSRSFPRARPREMEMDSPGLTAHMRLPLALARTGAAVAGRLQSLNLRCCLERILRVGYQKWAPLNSNNTPCLLSFSGFWVWVSVPNRVLVQPWPRPALASSSNTPPPRTLIHFGTTSASF